MPCFRTKESQEKYNAFRARRALDAGCILCAKDSIQSFTHWKIVVNEFPYDGISKKHDMIVSKRHTDESGLSESEKQELFELKGAYINDHYEDIIESTIHQKTIPEHFHLHLIVEAD